MGLDSHKFTIAEITDLVTDLDCGEGENPDVGNENRVLAFSSMTGFN